MPQKVRVTLESLNETMLEGFRRMDAFRSHTEDFQNSAEARFKTLQETVNRMAVYVARIPEIEARLTAIEARLDALEARMDNLEGLYQHLEKNLEILDHEYVSITAALKRLEERFDKLEADQLRDRVRILEQKVSVLEKSSIH